MQLLEFLPILVFVAIYYASDIFYATAALMVTTTLELGFMWITKRAISTQLKFTFWLSLVFGGLTLALHDKTFIQWKPTILNWAMAGALLSSHFFSGRNLLERMLGSQLSLPSGVWSRLNFGWSFGFFVAGALNLYVARNFSESFWVNYKLIGGFGITLFYVLVSVAYLTAGGHLSESAQNASKQVGKSS